MSTAYIPGKALHASFGGTDLTVKKSSIKCRCNMVKVTNKKTNGFQSVVGGIKSFNGTVTLAVDANAAVVVAEGDTIDLVVGVTGGRTITGKAFVSEVSDDADVEGDYVLTCTVDSTDAYTAV